MNPKWLTFDNGLAMSLAWILVFDPSPPKNSYSQALAAWTFLLRNDNTNSTDCVLAMGISHVLGTENALNKLLLL